LHEVPFMAAGNVVAVSKPNLYKDSVALMRITERLLGMAGIRRATLVMGTGANKEILTEARMLPASLSACGPGDLIIVIESDDPAQGEAALAEAEKALAGQRPVAGAGGEVAAVVPHALAQGLAGSPGAHLVQVSVPGPYAAAEAMKALKHGCNVFLFSDNVPLAEECALKSLAVRKGLLVMGPDCGTAILNGVPLGFANSVRRGAIGIVAASGTGLQEATVQINLGGGVSHAIGTGGRDISASVGGATMRQAIDLLAADEATRVILVVSKPPSAEVTERIVERLRAAGKPAVVLFIGARVSAVPGVSVTATLADAVREAMRLAGQPIEGIDERAPLRPSFVASQKYIRALYSGGTYCYEAQAIWRDAGLSVWSNAPLESSRTLTDAMHSLEHTALDLGDDRFTVGRPHPMIDPSMRIERLRAEARDKAVAVILLDVVLGYGSHEDPAGALTPAIRDARLEAAREGRSLAFVTFVCGTEEDPQKRSDQVRKLRDAGALVFAGSTAAAQAALRFVTK
jgi:succinyl-CoA synthetase alpha subunit